MCYFPIPNLNIDGIAYKKGITQFDCGSCPECLQKRSSALALKSVFEARDHAYNCMVTLTYDTFVRDEKGNFVYDHKGNRLENPVDPDLKVNKRDIQLFIKRLRKWYSTISSEKLKYRACAEYGSRTHRAHYHVLLFGVRFPDCHFYKKSGRGNVIYESAILTKLWNHGICTIDAINIHSAVALYTTKYSAKSRSDKTFMLCSQGIGLNQLLKHFNGYSYYVEGREYPIPRVVWEHYIVNKYKPLPYNFSPKYVNRVSCSFDDPDYIRGQLQREIYRQIRDDDPVYKRYIDYWKNKSAQFDSVSIPIQKKILQLNDNKYHFYRSAALCCYSKKLYSDHFICAPGSFRGVFRVPEKYRSSEEISYIEEKKHKFFERVKEKFNLPSDPCLYTASDTLSLDIYGDLYVFSLDTSRFAPATRKNE